MADFSKYQLLTKCFLAPHVVKANSIVYWSGMPHDGMRPLNQLAKDKMEEWYNLEHEVKDERTNTYKTVKPNEGKRPVEQQEGAMADTFQLVRDPPKDNPGNVLGLAEALNTRPGSPDYVPPGPAVPLEEVPEDLNELEEKA